MKSSAIFLEVSRPRYIVPILRFVEGRSNLYCVFARKVRYADMIKMMVIRSVSSFYAIERILVFYCAS